MKRALVFVVLSVGGLANAVDAARACEGCRAICDTCCQSGAASCCAVAGAPATCEAPAAAARVRQSPRANVTHPAPPAVVAAPSGGATWSGVPPFTMRDYAGPPYYHRTAGQGPANPGNTDPDFFYRFRADRKALRHY